MCLHRAFSFTIPQLKNGSGWIRIRDPIRRLLLWPPADVPAMPSEPLRSTPSNLCSRLSIVPGGVDFISSAPQISVKPIDSAGKSSVSLLRPTTPIDSSEGSSVSAPASFRPVKRYFLRSSGSSALDHDSLLYSDLILLSPYDTSLLGVPTLWPSARVNSPVAIDADELADSSRSEFGSCDLSRIPARILLLDPNARCAVRSEFRGLMRRDANDIPMGQPVGCWDHKYPSVNEFFTTIARRLKTNPDLGGGQISQTMGRAIIASLQNFYDKLIPLGDAAMVLNRKFLANEGRRRKLFRSF